MTHDEIRAAVAQELDARAAQEREREAESGWRAAFMLVPALLLMLTAAGVMALADWALGSGFLYTDGAHFVMEVPALAWMAWAGARMLPGAEQ